MSGKLIFKHGVMESGKSAELLMKAYLFEQKGKYVTILKPTLDIRSAQGVIESRVGISHDCVMIGPEDSVCDVVSTLGTSILTDIILVDEAQFLQESQVDELADVVDRNNILCIAYGLKNDFSGHLFPATRRLFELADRIDESPSMCDCGRKATMHYRIVESNEQVLCGDDIYKSVCRPCYNKLKAQHETY